MVLAAGRAADQVGAHAGHPCVGVRTAQLQFDVAVEVLEALLASELRLGGAQKALQKTLVLVFVRVVHRFTPLASGSSSNRKPWSAR